MVQNKVSKTSVNYSEGMKQSRCSNCQFYIPDTTWAGECKKVSGAIDPDYWCKLFKPKR